LGLEGLPNTLLPDHCFLHLQTTWSAIFFVLFVSFVVRKPQ